jgi:hypothetical protein
VALELALFDEHLRDTGPQVVGACAALAVA